MTLFRILAWARLCSLRNGARSERLFLGGKVAATVLVWAGAFTLGRRLAPPAGVDAPARLALIALGAWAAFALLAVPGVLRRSFADPEAAILLTQPLPAERRFRVLYGDLWLRNLLQLVPTALLVLLPALAVLPASTGLAWSFLILVGTGVSLAMVLATSFLVLLIRSGSAPGARRPALASAGILAVGVVALLASLEATVLFSSPGAGAGGPGAGGVLLAALLALGLGPGARCLGYLYVRSYLAQGASRRSAAAARRRFSTAWSRITRPAVGPVGAVLFKDGLAQARNPLAWIRLSLVAVSPLLAPVVRRMVAPEALPAEAFCVAFTLAVLLVAVHESLSGAVAGEGDRMLLFAASPRGIANLVRSKLAFWAGGAALLAGLLAAAVGAVLQEPPSRLLLCASAAALATAGGAHLLLLASAWDLRVEQAAGEGAVERLLREETPLGPRRLLAFLVLSPLLQAAVVLGLRRLPGLRVLALVGAADALLLVATLRLGPRLLARHLR